MNDTAAHQILNATARADHQFASAGRRSDLVCANPVCWIMTKRVHDSEFPDYREAKSERMNAARLRTQFIRRDATRRGSRPTPLPFAPRDFR